jgi:tRNA threonylcarbamoyladenosine biosynthesis protein TsaB
MKLLCVDTATSTESIALVDGEQILAIRSEERGGVHGPDILDDIHDLVAQAGLTFSAIDGFCVGLGPGSFTGLRISLATLKGLALATQKPLYGARTTQVLIHASTSKNTIAVVDARRNEVYVEGGPLEAPICCNPSAVGQYLDASTIWTFVGDGALKYERILKAENQCIIEADAENHQPNAAYLATLVNTAAPEILSTLEPIYVRKSDAEINYPDGFPDAAKRKRGSG